ncbi:MAG TPA: hypothetical protein VFY36_00570 [Solirubrobacteraceae bacterium]|nr:hypothetical protein [Solirubrobacteraceae bacterium]
MMAWFHKHRVAIAIGLATSVVATYLVRGLEWVIPRLLAVLVAAPQWLYLFVAAVVAVSFSAFATATLAAFVERFSRQLIVWASDRLPRNLRSLFRNQWLAQLDHLYDRPFVGLVFAIRIWVETIPWSRNMTP